MWIAIYFGCKNNENTFGKIYGRAKWLYFQWDSLKANWSSKISFVLTLFMILDPAARHSAPNHSCPPKLSVTISSGNFWRNSRVARPPAPSNSSSILNIESYGCQQLIWCIYRMPRHHILVTPYMLRIIIGIHSDGLTLLAGSKVLYSTSVKEIMKEFVIRQGKDVSRYSDHTMACISFLVAPGCLCRWVGRPR